MDRGSKLLARLAGEKRDALPGMWINYDPHRTSECVADRGISIVKRRGGALVDIMLSEHRDLAAAETFFRRHAGTRHDRQP
jgi:hypothetical protein